MSATGKDLLGLVLDVLAALAQRDRNEFFTAVAAQDVGFSAKDLLHDLRMTTNGLVSRLVTVLIIELLEVVQVDHEDCQRLLRSRTDIEQRFRLGFERASVEQTAERIPAAETVKLRIGQLEPIQQPIQSEAGDHADEQRAQNEAQVHERVLPVDRGIQHQRGEADRTQQRGDERVAESHAQYEKAEKGIQQGAFVRETEVCAFPGLVDQGIVDEGQSENTDQEDRLRELVKAWVEGQREDTEDQWKLSVDTISEVQPGQGLRYQFKIADHEQRDQDAADQNG